MRFFRREQRERAIVKSRRRQSFITLFEDGLEILVVAERVSAKGHSDCPRETDKLFRRHSLPPQNPLKFPLALHVPGQRFRVPPLVDQLCFFLDQLLARQSSRRFPVGGGQTWWETSEVSSPAAPQ